MNLVKPVFDMARFFWNHPLTRDDQLGAWTRLLSWQLRSRLNEECIVPWIEGQRLAVRRGMTGATGNIYAGLHEFADMALLLHYLRAGDLFLDIGANIGSYTILASGVRRASTWAFEPDPVTAARLRRNISLNGQEELVTVNEFALGDTDGAVTFTCGLDTVNRVVENAETGVRLVPMKRLDVVVGEANPAMMKLDVERYEPQVVRGAEQTLAKASLKLIEIETVTLDIDATFVRHGFKRGYYNPFHRTFSETPVEISAFNAVYVRDWDFVADRLKNAPAINVLGRAI